MEASHPGFLDDTSMSESVRSLVKTSTVAKEDIKWNEDAFFKRQDLAKASGSLYLHAAESPIGIQSATPRSVLNNIKFPLNYSVASDGANSSLGILHVEHLDLSDSCFKDPVKLEKKAKGKKTLQRSSKIDDEEKEKVSEENEEKYFCESSEVNFDTKYSMEADGECDSGSDIEYDGTNIPELNLDCDILSLLSSNKACVSSFASSNYTSERETPGVNLTETIPKESSDSGSCYFSPQLTNNESMKNDTAGRESSRSTRQSIFENYNSTHYSLYDQIVSGKQSVGKKGKGKPETIKVCPFLDMSSFEVEPILSRQNQHSAYSDVENTRCNQNQSIEFLPEQISARSSSFKSSRQFESPISSSGLSNFNEIGIGSQLSPFYQFQQSKQEEDLENEVLSGSQFQISKHKFQSLSGEDKSINNDKDSGFSAKLTDFEKSSGGLTSKLGDFGNFAFPSNLEFKNISGFGVEGENWCSRLGISDSDFFSSDAAKELLRKEKEEFEKDQLTLPVTNKISSVSNWSLTNQHEITAPSWLTGISPDAKEAGYRQVSIGTLIGARSENVGTLSEDPERERPYFGKIVITPPKETASDTDPFASKTSISSNSEDNSVRKLRISSLLDDISLTSDPMEFTSKLVKKCSAAFHRESKTSTNNHNVLNNEAGFEKTVPSKDRRCALSDIEESENNPFVKSSSSSNLSKQSDLDMEEESKTLTSVPPLCDDHSLNFSVDSSSERGSIKTTKSDTCSNCSAPSSQQKFSWHTPCSSACSIPLTVNNALCLQYGSMNHLNWCTNNCQNCLNNFLHQGQNSELPYPHASCAHPSLKPNILSASAPNLQSLYQGALCAPFLMTGASTSYLEIQVVPELNFPEKISVGDLQEMNLTIRNSRNVGCCYQISCVSAHLDGSLVPREKSGLNFNKIVSGGIGGVTDTMLILAPRYKGKVVVNLQIDAFLNPMAQALNAVPVSFANTKIQYEAVQPSITMLCKGRDTLDLGQVVAGSTFVEYITVTNNCDASVPLRISLSNNVSTENQIYFGLKEMNRQKNCGTLRILSPKVFLYRIPANLQFEIPTVFESINSRVDSTITAGIETPDLRIDLAFIKISASSGDAKLVLQDPTQNPLLLNAFKRAPCNCSVTVMNAGNLSVVYDIHIEGDSDVFSVSPNSLNLLPKQCANISVTFSPITYQTTKGILLAAAEPHGQICTVTEIIGQVTDDSMKSLPNLALSSQASRNAAKPTRDTNYLLVCNKKFLDWGGVEIDGKSIVKTCTIRNNSKEKLHVKFFIRESNQTFLLIDNAGNETSMYDVNLKAKEEQPISVAFTPKSISSYSGILGIKAILPEGSNQPKDALKFSIPLNGYGGTSKIKILGLPAGEGTGYCLDVDASDREDVVYKNFILQNVGCRPAFVKLLLTYGIVQNVTGRQTVIHPSEFVLLQNEKKNILLSVNCSNKNDVTNSELISVIYGDEIMRQRLRRWLSSAKNKVTNCNIDFNVPYDGEKNVPYDVICKPSPREDVLFNSHLKKLMIHIAFNGQNTSFSRMSFAGLSECHDSFSILSSNTTQAFRRLTIEDQSPRAKDSASHMNRLSLQIPFDANSSNSEAHDSAVASISNCLQGLKIDSWAVQPEELIIDSENQEKRILLKSHSDSDLRFKVESNINIITISPITGILSANKEIGLRLTLIHTNHNKLFDDYEGFIKILCDKAEKLVHVKVCRDLRKTRSDSPVPSNMSETVTSGFLDDSYYMDATIVEPMSAYIDVENIFNFPKDIDLRKTRKGAVSETVLTVCNPTGSTVTWDIKPYTMLFSEPFDDSLDSSSSTIEFDASNGTLGPTEKGNIVIKFLPCSVARFSQFFYLTLSSKNGKKQKCTISVKGEGVEDFPLVMQARNFEKNTKQAGSRRKASVEIFSESEICKFPKTAPGQKSMQSITLKNISDRDNKLTIVPPKYPFSVRHSSLLLKSLKFLSVPLYFKPQKPGVYEGEVKFVCENEIELRIKLNGLCHG